MSEFGISLFKTESLAMVDNLIDNSIQLLFVYENVYYRTISHRCSNQYELNASKEDRSNFC